MGTLTVRDFDTALNAYISSWEESFSWDNINLSEEAALTVKLEGKQWDGKFDYKIAEFVVRLQKAHVAAYNEQSGGKIKYNTSPMDKAGLRITVTVTPGCSCLKVFFKEMWAKMDSKDKRDAILGIALIFAIPAGIGFWHYCDKNAEIAKISADSAFKKFQEEKRAEIEIAVQERLRDEARSKDVMHAIDRAFNMADQTNASMAYLAGKMQKDDKMSVDGIGIPAADARRLFKSTRTTPTDDDMEEFRYFLDGDYVVTDIKRQTEDIEILFSDGKSRKFSLVWLEDAALESFYRACAQHNNGSKIPEMSLRLDAFFKGGVFQRGAVMGIGKPREGAISFNNAVMDAVRKQEEIDAEDVNK